MTNCAPGTPLPCVMRRLAKQHLGQELWVSAAHADWLSLSRVLTCGHAALHMQAFQPSGLTTQACRLLIVHFTISPALLHRADSLASWWLHGSLCRAPPALQRPCSCLASWQLVSLLHCSACELSLYPAAGLWSPHVPLAGTQRLHVTFQHLLQDQMAIEDLRYFMAVGMGISHYHKAPVNTDVVLLVSGDTCEWPALLQRLHGGPGRLLCSCPNRQLPARSCPGCHALL